MAVYIVEYMSGLHWWNPGVNIRKIYLTEANDVPKKAGDCASCKAQSPVWCLSLGGVCRYLFCDNLERNFNAHFLVELDSGGVVAYFLH